MVTAGTRWGEVAGCVPLGMLVEVGGLKVVKEVPAREEGMAWAVGRTTGVVRPRELDRARLVVRGKEWGWAKEVAGPELGPELLPSELV